MEKKTDRITKLEKKFEDEATINEEIDQEHAERIKTLESKVKWILSYINIRRKDLK